jgi:hypothetical protein
MEMLDTISQEFWKYLDELREQEMQLILDLVNNFESMRAMLIRREVYS